MKKTLLIIARHGNTFNKGDIVRRVGKTDLPLTEGGLTQGRQIGSYLRDHHILPQRIFTSTLLRTIQTAQQAQQEMQSSVPSTTLAMLNEIDYGVDENQPETRVVERIGKQALEKWEQEGIAPEGWQVDTQAIIANWRDFAATLLKEYTGQTIMAVTSNGIARFAPYLTGNFDEFRLHYPIKIATGALCLLENEGNSAYWQCKGWNIPCPALNSL